MGKWICKKCGNEVIGKVKFESEANLKLDKEGKIVSQDIEIKKKEFKFHICNKCGNKSYFLQDIAEWEE